MLIYVLNKNLEKIAIIDIYQSVIWANRYNDLGDCELHVKPTVENLQLYQIGYYLARHDDDMVCRINKIEIDTNVQTGNTLIVRGVDVKSFLDQRIVWNTYNANTTTEAFLRELVYSSMVSSNIPVERVMTKQNGTALIELDTIAGFADTIKEQVSYKNVGEKVREICKEKKWGYYIKLGTASQGTPRTVFKFGLYAGTDKTDSVIFSPMFDNLKESKYILDASRIGNTSLIGGQGNGTERIMTDVGADQNPNSYKTGVDRYEVFIDAKDIPTTITWGELIAAYPQGTGGNTGYISYKEGQYYYRMHLLSIPVYSDTQANALHSEYPNGDFTHNRKIFTVDEAGQIGTGAIIADLPSGNPQSTDSVTLRDGLYDLYLINRALEKMAETTVTTSFDGSIIPNVNYTYRIDYNLGDIVTVKNEFGISKAVRIIEALESESPTGNVLEIKYETRETE